VEGTAEPWRAWPRKGAPAFAHDTTTGHGDTASLRIAALEEGVDGSYLQGVACEGGTPYDYAFWFRTDPPGGTVSFLAEFGAADGTYAGQHRREIKAEGAAWTRAAGSFVAPAQAVNVQFEVWVNLDNVGQGTAWFDDFSLEASDRPWVEMTLDDPLYHLLRPGDGPLRFRLTQTNPRAPTTRYVAELRAGEQVLEARAGHLGLQTEVELPRTKITQDGVYALSVKVEVENEMVFQTEETIVHRAEPPLVDIGPHRELLVDGRPFFPIGVYWTRKEDLPDLPANGFNCTHAWLYPNEDGRAFLDEAQRVGLRVVLEMSDTLRGQTALDQIRERVEFFRQEPTLLCYYPVDEPSPPHTDPAGMRQAYNLIKALDPDHPALYVQCNMAHLGTYIGATDIMAVDPYGSPDLVQQWMGLASAASQHRKPVWAVIGTFPWGAFGGLPTPEYVRAATYVALISGAKGVLYFTYHFDQHNLKQSVLWEPLGRLNAEIAQLAPWLLAGEPMPVETSDERIVAATFEGQDGLVLLAANKSETEAVEAELKLPGVRGEARWLFADTTAPCDEKVTVRLPPYGTAALKLPVQEAE